MYILYKNKKKNVMITQRHSEKKKKFKLIFGMIVIVTYG